MIAFLLAAPVATAGATFRTSGHSDAATAYSKAVHAVAARSSAQLRDAGLHVSGPWGSLSVESVDAGKAGWTRAGKHARRPTSFGAESVVLGSGQSEEFLRVERRQGVRVWRWRLVGNLTPKLAPDGGIRFAAGARVTGPRIDPVEILDVRGHKVTPRGLRWQLQHRGRTWYLALRLDDRALPVPYVIDPAITFRASGGSTLVGNGAAISITKPAGAAPNDLLVASLAIAGGQNTTFTAIPNGWTQIRRTNNGTSVALVTFSHVVGASGDVGPYRWTLGQGRKFVGSITTYVGVDASAPVVQTNANNSSSSVPVVGGVTGTINDWGVVAIASLANTSYTAGGYGERYDAATGGGGSVTGQGGDFAMAGGASGTKYAVGGASGAWAMQLIELRVDTEPPTNALTVTETINPDSFVNGRTFYYRPSSSTGGSFSVTSTASDGTPSKSGIRRVNFPALAKGIAPTTAFDSLYPGPYSRAYSWSGGNTASDSGTKVVTAYDNAGNTTTNTFTLAPDSSAPVTTDNTAAIGASWRTNPQTVTLTSNDSGSGVEQTYYTVNGTVPTTASAQGTAIPLSADGVYTIKYFSRDRVSNQEAVQTGAAQVRIDQTAPSSATLDPLPAFIANGQRLTSSGADAMSGVASIRYSYCAGAGCAPSTLIGSSTVAPNYAVVWNGQGPDGVYRVSATVVDGAGNTLDSAVQTVQVDNSGPPAPALSFSNFIDTSITGSNVFFRPGTGGYFTITADASDVSGIARVDFPVIFNSGWTGGGSDTAAPYEMTYRFTDLAQVSPGTLNVTATNNLGLSSAPASFTLTADGQPPSSSIACDDTACARDWYRNGVVVSLVSTDLGSGNDHIRYTTDGTDPDRYNGTTYTSPILLDSPTTLKWRAYDNVNNAEPVQTRLLKVDVTPPVTTVNCGGASCDDSWHAPGLAVALNSTDSDSGVSRIRYTTDGTDPDLANGDTYSGPITINSGTPVRFRAYDNVGNAEPVQVVPIRVDASGPSMTITSPLPNEAVRNGMFVSAEATDGQSGVKSVDFRYCAGTTCSWDSGVILGSSDSEPYSALWVDQPADGVYTVVARGDDNVGNVGESSPITITIDNVGDTVGSGGANPIQAENALAGTTAWQIGLPPFQVGSDAVSQIKGYASATSVNRGDPIDFKVSVNPAQSYTIDIYRLGCYPDASGTCLGGRFMRHLGPYDGIHQPACKVDGPTGGNTGLTECNWTGTSFTVPATWTSGIYVAQLTNEQYFQNDIVFVVRDDASHSAILYQQPVATYQAYNNYPDHGGPSSANGKSLYDSSSGGGDTVAGVGRPRAVKVSFDRPYAGQGYGDLLDPNGWSWEQYFIRFAEKSGYDLSYSTNVDTQARPALMRNHRSWISVGHDEYWSGQMYDAAASARDNGVNLGFFGGNDVYWQIRFEPSSSGVPNRTVVGYKNTPNNSYTTVDPVAATNPSQATVRFQDPPVNRPGQLLTGLSFAGGTARSNRNTPYNVLNPDAWVYDGTGFTGGSSVPAIVGYEADGYNCMFGLPENRSYTLLSNSPMQDESSYWQTGNSVLYQAPGGAWVFHAGSMSWSWALDRSTPAPDQGLPTGWVDPGIQQATKNVLDGFSGTKTMRPTDSYVPDCATHKLLSFESGQLVTGPPPQPQDGADRLLGNVTLETVNPIKGNYSERLANVGNSYLDKIYTASDDLELTFYLRLNAMPSTDTRVAMLQSQLQGQGNVVIRPPGVLCIRNANAWINGTPANSCTSAPLALGTTYRIKMHQVTGTGTDGILEGYLATGDAPFGAPFVKTSKANLTMRSDKLSIGTSTVTALDAVIDDISIDGTPLAKPAGPGGLAVTAPLSSTEADVSWTDNADNESSYVLERSASSSFDNATTFKLPAGTTSYADTSVTTSTTYWYRVKAINVAGSSDYSGSMSVTTRPPPPAAPTALVATILSQSAIKLDWTDNATNETGYVVERAPDPLFVAPTVVELSPDTQTFTDVGLAPRPYYYRVKAINVGTTGSAYTNTVRGPRIKDITFEDGTPTLVNVSTGVDRNAGGVAVQETANPIKGAFSARIPNVPNVYVEQNLGDVDDLYISFYLRLNQLPTAENRIAQVMSGATTISNVWIRTNATLCLKYGNFWSGGAVGPGCTPISSPLVAGTTYRVAIHQRRGNGTTNAYVEAFLATGDAPFAAAFTSQSVPASAGTVGGYWTTPATQFRIGATLNTFPMDMVFDDMKIDSMFLPGPSP